MTVQVTASKPSYVLDESMKDAYPGVDYYRQLLTTESTPMKLNLDMIQPLIAAGTLKPVTIDGVLFFQATVIQVKEDKKSISIELVADDGDSEMTAKLKYEGVNEVSHGAQIKFNAEGEIKYVELPPKAERAVAPSARRSPDRAVQPGLAARRDY